MNEKIFHKKRVTRCGDSKGDILDTFIELVIENNAIDDYAKGITDKEYIKMEQLEKQIQSALNQQELLKERIPKVINIAECLDDFHSGDRIKELLTLSHE